MINGVNLILEDSRQQESKHSIKHKVWMKNGVHWNRGALICGDYQLPGDGSIAVDTKFSIQELEGDITFHAIPQKDIKQKLSEISMRDRDREVFFHLVVDDDSERFPEKEITDYAYSIDMPEGEMKKVQELYVKRHGFFHRGLIRAKNYGVKLYVLVDNRDGVTDVKSLFKWVNPRRRVMVTDRNKIIGFNKNNTPKYARVQKYPHCMMGEQLAKACITMEKKYGVKFLFCTPEESATIIVELLTGTKQ